MVKASSAAAGRAPPISAAAIAPAPSPLALMMPRREMSVCMMLLLARAQGECDAWTGAAQHRVTTELLQRRREDTAPHRASPALVTPPPRSFRSRLTD